MLSVETLPDRPCQLSMMKSAHVSTAHVEQLTHMKVTQHPDQLQKVHCYIPSAFMSLSKASCRRFAHPIHL